MNYYNKIEFLFILITPLGLLAYFLNALFISRSFDNATESIKVKTNNIILSPEKRKLTMKEILQVITLFFLGGLIVAVFYYKIYIIEILFFSSIIIEHFNYFFNNLTKVKNSINQELSNRMSIKERGRIVGLIGLICFMILYRIPNNVILTIQSLNNSIFSDFLLVFLLIILSMTYIFFICYSLLEIMNFIVFNVKNIFEKIKKILLIKISHFLYEEIHKDFSWEFKSVSFFEKKRPLLLNIVVLPIISIDIICKLLYCIYRMLIGYLYNLSVFFNYLGFFFITIFENIQNISDRKFVVIFLRGSFILAVLSVVIYNRYNPLMKQQSEGTIILEFLSSTILIPLLLSWVLKLKER